jgi:metal-responsive CopG/Arc/MetJ family transcriptional regulator
VKITITLPEKILNDVDDIRGLVPRATWIQYLISKNINKERKIR